MLFFGNVCYFNRLVFKNYFIKLTHESFITIFTHVFEKTGDEETVLYVGLLWVKVAIDYFL